LSKISTLSILKVAVSLSGLIDTARGILITDEGVRRLFISGDNMSVAWVTGMVEDRLRNKVRKGDNEKK